MRRPTLVLAALVAVPATGAQSPAFVRDAAMGIVSTRPDFSEHSNAFYVGQQRWLTTLHGVTGEGTVRLKIAIAPEVEHTCAVVDVEDGYDLALLRCDGVTPTDHFRVAKRDPARITQYDLVVIRKNSTVPYLEPRNFGRLTPTNGRWQTYHGCLIRQPYETLTRKPDGGHSGAPLLSATDPRVVYAMWSHRHDAAETGIVVTGEKMEAFLDRKGDDDLKIANIAKRPRHTFVQGKGCIAEPTSYVDDHLDEGACVAALRLDSPAHQLRTACGLSASDAAAFENVRLLEDRIYQGQGRPSALVALVDSGLGGGNGFDAELRPDRAHLADLLRANRVSLVRTRQGTRTLPGGSPADFVQSRFESGLMNAALKAISDDLRPSTAAGALTRIHSLARFLGCGTPLQMWSCLVDEKKRLQRIDRVRDRRIVETPPAALQYLRKGALGLGWGSADGARDETGTWHDVVDHAIARARDAGCPLRDADTEMTWQRLIDSPRFQVGLWLGYERAGIFSIDAIYREEFDPFVHDAGHATRAILADYVTDLRAAADAAGITVHADMRYGLDRLTALLPPETGSQRPISDLLAHNICLFPDTLNHDSQPPRGIGTHLYYALDAAASATCAAFEAARQTLGPKSREAIDGPSLCGTLRRSEDRRLPAFAASADVTFIEVTLNRQPTSVFDDEGVAGLLALFELRNSDELLFVDGGDLIRRASSAPAHRRGIPALEVDWAAHVGRFAAGTPVRFDVLRNGHRGLIEYHLARPPE